MTGRTGEGVGTTWAEAESHLLASSTTSGQRRTESTTWWTILSGNQTTVCCSSLKETVNLFVIVTIVIPAKHKYLWPQGKWQTLCLPNGEAMTRLQSSKALLFLCVNLAHARAKLINSLGWGAHRAIQVKCYWGKRLTNKVSCKRQELMWVLSKETR